MVHDFFLGKILVISPQAWGCTVVRRACGERRFNLPTGVGMYRADSRGVCVDRQSPHRRGDVPVRLTARVVACRISPQAWGCTDQTAIIVYGRSNLPTGVGMYRLHRALYIRSYESPHRRGDVPFNILSLSVVDRISPQAWGCTVAS